MSHRSNENSSTGRNLGTDTGFTPNHKSVGETPFPLSARDWSAIAIGLQLSNRELQVIQGIFDGNSEAAIAAGLRLSAHTIHSHLCRVYRKLGVSSRTALALRIFAEYLARTNECGIVGQVQIERSTVSIASPVVPDQSVHETPANLQLRVAPMDQHV